MLVLLCAFILTACSSTPAIMSSWKAGSACRKNIWWTTGECRQYLYADADTRVLTYVEYDGEGIGKFIPNRFIIRQFPGRIFPVRTRMGKILSIAKFPLPSTTALSPVTILTATTVRENCCRAVQTSTQA